MLPHHRDCLAGTRIQNTQEIIRGPDRFILGLLDPGQIARAEVLVHRPFICRVRFF